MLSTVWSHVPFTDSWKGWLLGVGLRPPAYLTTSSPPHGEQTLLRLLCSLQVTSPSAQLKRARTTLGVYIHCFSIAVLKHRDRGHSWEGLFGFMVQSNKSPSPSWQGSVAVSRHGDRTAESSHLERKEAASTLGMAQAFKTSKSTPGNAFSNKASLLPPGTPQTALPTEYSAKPETSENIASHHRVLLGAPGHKSSGDGAPGCLSEAQHVFPNLSYRDDQSR